MVVVGYAWKVKQLACRMGQEVTDGPEKSLHINVVCIKYIAKGMG